MHCFVLYPIVFFCLLKSLSAQDILRTVEAVVGHSAELPCNVTAENEDDKLNILAWYRNDSSTAFYSSRDLREGASKSVAPPGGRYRLVTSESMDVDKLQIITVRASDAGVYHCLADFASTPAHKTYVQLDVIEPPRHLWVIYENGTQVTNASAGVNVSHNVGPYYVGDTVQLFCVAFGGKPRASLSWRTEQGLLKDTSTPLSELRVRSDLMYGPLRREDHGKVLTCRANNNDKTKPLSIDVTIDMYLPPELVSLHAEGPLSSVGVAGRVRAGEALALQCRVLGARPPPTLVWRFNDSQLVNLEQNITMESSQRLLVSDIQLTMDRRFDESRVTCCALVYQRGDDSYLCAQGLPLTVLYPPVLQIMVEEDVDNNTVAVVKGSNVSLACSHQANPSIYQLIWFHEEYTLSNGDENSGKMQSILELKNVKESDAGEYVCSATNEEGTSYSDPVVIDVTYPSYCEDESTAEYGVGENESINITCVVKGNPEPTSYRWVLVNEAVNLTTLRNHPHTTVDTEGATLLYERPNGTAYSTIFCWGLNDVPAKGTPHTPCTFLVTDETIPRPPTDCAAVKTANRDIVVTCEKGHDGRLPQKFKFTLKDAESDEQLLSIVNLEPSFMIQEPKQKKYEFIITAFNDKGESSAVEIKQDDIVDETIIGADVAVSAVRNITTLSLALCGGVLLVALAACGLVLCAHDRADAPRALAHADPPLCAYNTEESNCETCHDSDDGSECNVRRTESFRRAVSRYPSKNFDVRRTSSFHSARYMNDVEHDGGSKYNDVIRHSANCRVHSLQNINKKREMDALCDHLVLHLPPETNYNVPRPMNTFYTMPRKMRNKVAKELSDETSEITQTSDGFSLPPPPDEFGTYRAATRIKDMPSKSTPTYTTIIRNNSTGRDPTRQYNNAMSTMNTVGLPTISGAQNSLYTYPDDDHHGHQGTRDMPTTSGVPTYQTYYRPRESGQ